MAQFEISDLSFTYPLKEEKTIKNINLKVESGEFITLIGRSGSGKTTLLRQLKTVLAPVGKKEGTVLFNGKELSTIGLREESSKIGYVMQNPESQTVTDRVWHELAFGLESLGVDQNTIRLRVAEMASFFGIQNWFNKDVAELSGGQKQLLNLASVMAMQPEVLILDEPTSQLDPIAASDFLATIKKINLELGTTIIITEHRLEDVIHMSDRIIVMEDGKIIADEKPENVGKVLLQKNSEIFHSMPTPVKVYYSVKSDGMPPLTVREGRSWLLKEFDERDIRVKDLNPDSIYDIDDKELALEVKEVWMRYRKEGDDILKDVNLFVPSGSIFALLGGNGTGKSTLLKVISGICSPYRGSIRVKGKKASRDLLGKTITMLPQDPKSIFVKKTVKEELMEMVEKGEEEKIMELAKLCEVDSLFDSHPYDLSGGETERVALCKVLLTDPDILLLDEPTKGMDNFFKEKFAEIMINLKKRGVTVILVSHDAEFCAEYADYTGLFFDGSVITVNVPDRFFRNNSFYTTKANRMSKGIFDAVKTSDLIELYRINQGQ
ncbi:MAG: ATP-binding cassette domain-containing protein [Clostridia bacterium]|nr:ATP-binding cassette domain-containing protein [Clostridia bacterium]